MSSGQGAVFNPRWPRESFNYYEPKSVTVHLQSGVRYVAQPPHLALRPTAFILLVILGIVADGTAL